MRRIRPRTSLRQIPYALVCALALGAAGCGATTAIFKLNHIQDLREAQDQFNQAAALENQLKLNPLSTDALATHSQIQTSYRAVLATMTNLVKSSGDQLVADQLMGTAQMLKALSEWRLGDYRAAIATIDTLTQSKESKLFARDAALARAFRGLIKNDQAFRHMQARSATYAELDKLLTESVDNIDDGIAAAPASHDVRTYLIMAQLAAMKNRVDLFNSAAKYAKDKPDGLDLAAETQRWCAALGPIWRGFEQQIERLNTPATGQIQRDWEKRLLLPDACTLHWKQPDRASPE